MQRATAAILLMQSEGAEINFRSVAARAKVSTAWLYGTKSLRDKIMKIRTTSPAAAGENLQHRQRLSHERVVATLRLHIRTLEEINRELKEQLEAAYSRLATVQPKRWVTTPNVKNSTLTTSDRIQISTRQADEPRLLLGVLDGSVLERHVMRLLDARVPWGGGGGW